MRFLVVALAVVFVLLQYSLWIAEDGIRALWRLEAEIAARTLENSEKAARNTALEAEVGDLKEGVAAVEEKARNELGLVGREETFYLVTRRHAAGSEPAQ